MIQRDLRGLQPKFLLKAGPSAALDRVSHGFVQLSLANLQGQGPATRTMDSPGRRGAVSALVSIQPGWEAVLAEQKQFWV